MRQVAIVAEQEYLACSGTVTSQSRAMRCSSLHCTRQSGAVLTVRVIDEIIASTASALERRRLLTITLCEVIETWSPGKPITRLM